MEKKEWWEQKCMNRSYPPQDLQGKKAFNYSEFPDFNQKNGSQKNKKNLSHWENSFIIKICFSVIGLKQDMLLNNV